MNECVFSLLHTRGKKYRFLSDVQYEHVAVPVVTSYVAG